MFEYSMIQPLFWMAIGLLIAFFFFGLRYWFQDLKIRMYWWKWLLVVIWLIILAVILGGAFTLIGENEPKAGVRFLLFFGVIILLIGGGIWKIVARK